MTLVLTQTDDLALTSIHPGRLDKLINIFIYLMMTFIFTASSIKPVETYNFFFIIIIIFTVIIFIGVDKTRTFFLLRASDCE